MISADRRRPAVVRQLAIHSTQWRGAGPWPDLWNTNPDNVFDPSGEQPAPASSGHAPKDKEVKLKDHSGHLRPPAYILIALVIALVAILLLTAGVMLALG